MLHKDHCVLYRIISYYDTGDGRRRVTSLFDLLTITVLHISLADFKPISLINSGPLCHATCVLQVCLLNQSINQSNLDATAHTKIFVPRCCIKIIVYCIVSYCTMILAWQTSLFDLSLSLSQFAEQNLKLNTKVPTYLHRSSTKLWSAYVPRPLSPSLIAER